jgi:ABC-type branched-subunit amino acid transport system substrate-binding protein
VPTVLDTPVDFSGSRGTTVDPTRLDEIRIGLFAPIDPDHPVGRPMYNAAQLAAQQANAAGGYRGTPFRIVTRWDDDPWRGGSKQMIKLVYEDSVWAVVGSVSGDATHIAEQVVTKAWLPLVSPASADPTLTYIRIPWMFRLPPNDQVQAETIVQQGLRDRALRQVGLITSTDHDGRVFAEEMLDQLHANATPPVFHLQLTAVNLDYRGVAQRAQDFGPEAIILRLPPSELVTALRGLRDSGFTAPLFVPWIPGVRLADLEEHYDGEVLYVMPFAIEDSARYRRFVAAYEERFGDDPTATAAYTYDAVNLIMLSIGHSGLNRSSLRDTIAGSSGYEGVTPEIRWDNAGGNEASPVLVGGR